MMSTSVQSFIQSRQIQAVGLTVSDIDRAISFYTKALCFELIFDITATEVTNSSKGANQTPIRIATLKLGDEQIRLMQYLDHPGKPIPADSQSNDLWFQHLAIVVSDMDRAYAHLQSFSFEPISTAPQTIPPDNQEAAYIQAFKFRDPDHHPLELICFPPDKGQAKWQQHDRLFLGIDHTAIAIANTEQTLPFYRDVLGMRVDGGSFNWQETQAHMDGLPNAKVHITALRPIEGGLGVELLDYVEPTNGRSMPPDLSPHDIVYAQIELRVKRVNTQFHQNETQYIVQDAGQIECPLLNHSIYKIQDPTGHFLVLIPDQS